MNSDVIVSSTARFACITGTLCRAVAASLGRGLMEVAVILLVWRRVRRAENLFLALVDRLRAGRLRSGGTRAPVISAVDDDGAGDVVVRRVRAEVSYVRLPRRFGWLMQLLPCEAANLAGQLRTVLTEPGMEGLLAEVPQARRILGPLCRMLGVDLAGFVPVAVALPESARDSAACLPVTWIREAFGSPKGVALPLGGRVLWSG